MSYFSRHLFFCTNQRDDGSQCCNQCGAQEARDYVKRRCKELGISGPGKVRVNNAGCLDRCVVYPEAVWYTYVDRQDLDEIIDSHLVQGRVVDRLRLDPE
jgi:(2Fe-2S) ferredoxin